MERPGPALPSPPRTDTETGAARAVLFDLFPEISPYSSGFLAVEEPHNLYWEQSGNPEGVPIILLHGGPGAGSSPLHRRFFDPAHYRIILFDQRGAGRSTPMGSLVNNTTAHLVADMERLRQHLKIERWHIFGGSWGSTLALAYAGQHAQRCLSLILRGIFLCEQPEIQWFLYGIGTVFPEAWARFAEFIPEKERGDLLSAYYARLTAECPQTQLQAAIQWSLYESAASALFPVYEMVTTLEQKKHALSIARIEAHYFKHNVIAPENSLLKQVDAFRAIPATIVQGRYDMICPVITANRLHKVWPEADYIIVPDAGHTAQEPSLRSRLIEACEHAKTIREQMN
ncbi:MAG: prolyl aminopeptidase [Alphaproteobacteria bacterium]|nr:prolyl aminopeptidase [Alphaproteobacteria bacterium]